MKWQIAYMHLMHFFEASSCAIFLSISVVISETLPNFLTSPEYHQIDHSGFYLFFKLVFWPWISHISVNLSITSNELWIICLVEQKTHTAQRNWLIVHCGLVFYSQTSFQSQKLCLHTPQPMSGQKCNGMPLTSFTGSDYRDVFSSCNHYYFNVSTKDNAV